MGCQRTGREDTEPPAEMLGDLKERKEIGGTRVDFYTRKFRTWALAWLVEYLPSIDKALTSISKTP